MAPASREGLVGDAGRAPAPGSTTTSWPWRDELAHDVGHERDPALAVGGLLGDSDPHEGGNLSERGGGVRRDPLGTPAAGGAPSGARSTAASAPAALASRARGQRDDAREADPSGRRHLRHELVERDPLAVAVRSSGSATPAVGRAGRLGRRGSRRVRGAAVGRGAGVGAGVAPPSARAPPRGAASGNALPASAVSACAVTHTGVCVLVRE